jgi:ferredoxin
MAHVILEKCLGEVYAACVDVCPVECIHPGDYKNEKFMIIDPEVCIDCGVCLPECPIGAIVGSVDESPEWAKINAELTPEFKTHPKLTPRPPNDPPRKPGNKLVK